MGGKRKVLYAAVVALVLIQIVSIFFRFVQMNNSGQLLLPRMEVQRISCTTDESSAVVWTKPFLEWRPISDFLEESTVTPRITFLDAGGSGSGSGSNWSKTTTAVTTALVTRATRTRNTKIRDAGVNRSIATTAVKTAPAVCQYLPTRQKGYHFPHVMEQLYRCYSYWEGNPDKAWILMYPSDDAQDQDENNNKNSEFLKGFLRDVTLALNVTIVPYYWNVTIFPYYWNVTGYRTYHYHNKHSQHLLPGVQYRIVTVKEGRAAKWFAVQHASHLRRLTHKLLNFHYPAFVQKLKQQQAKTTNREPRIVILNRRGSRQLLNHQQVVEAWAERCRANAPSHTDSSQSNTATTNISSTRSGSYRHSGDIQIRYLEEKSFEHQVRFFASADIVISPHGAQLTGVAFQPECGAILEIFAKGYYVGGYFTSLAQSAGLYHGAWYLSEYNPHPKWDVGATPGERGVARQKNMCPPMIPMMQAIDHMVQYWHACQHNRTMKAVLSHGKQHNQHTTTTTTTTTLHTHLQTGKR